MKIVICTNTSWNLVNFRSNLIRAFVKNGHEVLALSPYDEYTLRLEELGCRHVPLDIDQQGTNVFRDMALTVKLFQILKKEGVDAYLGFTIKPNIFGSIAANLLGIPVINNIAGLGIAFSKKTLLSQLVRFLYRTSLKRSNLVFFQNEDDRQLFVESGLVRAELTDRLPGSGVDLNRFRSLPLPPPTGPTRFILVARMLWEKGVGDFVAAAALVKKQFPETEFCLLGFLDVQNPSAIPPQKVDEWVKEGWITYLGDTHDVRPILAQASCVVLPSYYREGVPRSLLEAAAMGRPIITTDSVGCREVVEDGKNGYLCKPRDPGDLAEKMTQYLSLSFDDRRKMGAESRNKAQIEFNEEVVIRRYLTAVNAIGT